MTTEGEWVNSPRIWVAAMQAAKRNHEDGSETFWKETRETYLKAGGMLVPAEVDPNQNEEI